MEDDNKIVSQDGKQSKYQDSTNMTINRFYLHRIALKYVQVRERVL